MVRIVAVKAVEPYQIWIRFADGLEGTINLSELIGQGVFQRLADPAEFSKVYVDSVTHTVAWPGGIDLCPDTLYEDVCKQQRAA